MLLKMGRRADFKTAEEVVGLWTEAELELECAKEITGEDVESRFAARFVDPIDVLACDDPKRVRALVRLL